MQLKESKFILCQFDYLLYVSSLSTRAQIEKVVWCMLFHSFLTRGLLQMQSAQRSWTDKLQDIAELEKEKCSSITDKFMHQPESHQCLALLYARPYHLESAIASAGELPWKPMMQGHGASFHLPSQCIHYVKHYMLRGHTAVESTIDHIFTYINVITAAADGMDAWILDVTYLKSDLLQGHTLWVMQYKFLCPL
ncbi:plant acid phosphatase family protein, expressed [Canna indica]|uniref:Plant acid phosphatase family protein, expressed n=1 Tax=Canna indica TaxID=4628 RepID=A0AAQ3Q8B7_9LILI|nr:plant acid phosphatase family protein, expressed [Canna indica]